MKRRALLRLGVAAGVSAVALGSAAATVVNKPFELDWGFGTPHRAENPILRDGLDGANTDERFHATTLTSQSDVERVVLDTLPGGVANSLRDLDFSSQFVVATEARMRSPDGFRVDLGSVERTDPWSCRATLTRVSEDVSDLVPAGESTVYTSLSFVDNDALPAPTHIRARFVGENGQTTTF